MNVRELEDLFLVGYYVVSDVLELTELRRVVVPSCSVLGRPSRGC